MTSNRTLDAEPVALSRPGDAVDAANTLAKVMGGLLGEPVAPKIGRYYLLEGLGQGAMGVVHAAYDPTLDRKVALKVERSLGASAHRRERSLREARALARLSHPNVVAVHEVGTEGESLYIAMDFVQGSSLDDWVAGAEPTRDEIWRALAQVAAGLQAAHDAGLVHGDVKPSNVLRREDGRVLVVDFGLARAPEPDVAPTGEGDTTHRGFGGTPAYAAPEQESDEALTASSDQFAFAVMAWEMLLGERPYKGESRAQLAMQKRHGPPSARGLSRREAAALSRALSPEPAKRFASMAAMVEAARPRRRSVAPWVALGLAGAVAMGVLAGRETAAPPPEVDPCAGVEAAGEAAWSADQRARLATRVAEAAETPQGEAWAAVQGRLDAATRRWGQLAREGCELAQATELAQPVTEAFDHCRERTARLIGQVGTRVDEAKDARKLATELDRLAMIEHCGPNRRALLEQQLNDPRRGGHPQLVATTQTLRSLWFGGKKDEARELVNTLEEELAQGGDPYNQVEAHRILGLVQTDDVAAERHFWSALELGMANRLDHLALIAATDLAQRMSRDPKRIADAIGLLRLVRNWADSVLAGDDSDGTLRTSLAPFLSRVENLLGWYEEDLGNQSAAEGHYKRSADFARLSIALRPERVVFPLNNLAELARQRGEFDEALAFFDEALSVMDAYFKDKPDLRGKVLANRIGVAVAAGKLGEAVKNLAELERSTLSRPPHKLPHWLASLKTQLLWSAGDREGASKGMSAWAATAGTGPAYAVHEIAIWQAVLAPQDGVDMRALSRAVKGASETVDGHERLAELTRVAAHVAMREHKLGQAKAWAAHTHATLDKIEQLSPAMQFGAAHLDASLALARGEHERAEQFAAEAARHAGEIAPGHQALGSVKLLRLEIAAAKLKPASAESSRAATELLVSYAGRLDVDERERAERLAAQ